MDEVTKKPTVWFKIKVGLDECESVINPQIFRLPFDVPDEPVDAEKFEMKFNIHGKLQFSDENLNL